MCFAASHYARIGRIVFGATLGDLQALTGNEMMGGPGGMAEGTPRLTGECLRRECVALLEHWAGGRRR
jgi:tRNA(Arg) A34 adenosine deaminase TadA